MALPPLPDVPTVRVKLDYTVSDGTRCGQRFYLKYSGGPPSAADCSTLASDIATAWSTHLAELINVNFTLTEVDVEDIALRTGASGQWNGSEPGTGGGTGTMPVSIAVNVRFIIARRYRGGKPRTYVPPPEPGNLASVSTWSGAFVADSDTRWAAFFTDLAGLTAGTITALQHVNLSYYELGTPEAGEPTEPHETYKPVATSDVITGYATQALISQQRRRRQSTAY